MAALEPQHMAILKKVLAHQACEGAVPDLLQARHRAAGVHPRLCRRDEPDHLHGGNQGARRHQHAGGAGQGRSRHAVVQDASDHAANVGTNPWKYLLVPHDEVNESKRLADYLRDEVKA